jgi:hypothetical protein
MDVFASTIGINLVIEIDSKGSCSTNGSLSEHSHFFLFTSRHPP